MKRKTIFISAIAIAAVCGMAGCSKQYEMGTYGYDKQFLSDNNIPTVELKSPDGKSELLIAPGLQGRVMTSTTDGDKGTSFGWVNYKFIEAGKVSDQFNPNGGEERFWIGPEGGPFSWYFKRGQEQVYENWRVPKFIDTEAFDIESQSDSDIVFVKNIQAVNASDHAFKIGVRRRISLVQAKDMEELFGTQLSGDLKYIAYKSENTLTNDGDSAWTKETGMPSVWLLGTFNPTPTTTVFIPYNEEYEGLKVNDMYFGKVPSDRLILKDGVAYFKIDGKYRSKIGLPSGSAKDLCGSYDYDKGVLNILKYTVPAGDADYVNGQWGPQEDPFSGDVINSYNDGPTETGYVQGPFYEIETSSPGASLEPGQSLTHVQYTIHFQGNKDSLNEIAQKVFGVSLDEVSEVFK